ncbi:hypothetical protein BKA81DRAFT_132666 [Phyllosticta paracitricarpa]
MRVVLTARAYFVPVGSIRQHHPTPFSSHLYFGLARKSVRHLLYCCSSFAQACDGSADVTGTPTAILQTQSGLQGSVPTNDCTLALYDPFTFVPETLHDNCSGIQTKHQVTMLAPVILFRGGSATPPPAWAILLLHSPRATHSSNIATPIGVPSTACRRTPFQNVISVDIE